MNPAKVMLATPNFESKFHFSYIRSLMDTIRALAARGIEVVWWPRCGDSLLPACRNLIAMEFVKRPELTHLLWIDADMTWTGADVLRLLDHDLDIVAGLYRAKSREERYDYGALPGVAPDPRTGLMEVDCAGTGFMLTRRAVYEAMMAAFPERMAQRGEGMYRCHGDSEPGLIFDFFPLLLSDGTYMAEDISFCRSWRTIGGRVMVDATLRLGHEGRHVFTGDPMATLTSMARVSAAA